MSLELKFDAMGSACFQGYTSRGIRCWTGNDDEAYVARHEAGAVGAVSVASNLIPGIHTYM